MSGFRSLNNSTSKRVLNLLEPVMLTVWKVMIERVTVVKFRVNYRGGNGAGCFEVEVWADTPKFTDVIVTRLRKCSDLIREGNVFIKNKTKVAEWVVVREQSCILQSCCLSPIRRNSVLEELRVRRSKKWSVVEHFVSDWCWSGNVMDGSRRKVVCHLHIGGDLKKEMKQEYWVG